MAESSSRPSRPARESIRDLATQSPVNGIRLQDPRAGKASPGGTTRSRQPRGRVSRGCRLRRWGRGGLGGSGEFGELKEWRPWTLMWRRTYSERRAMSSSLAGCPSARSRVSAASRYTMFHSVMQFRTRPSAPKVAGFIRAPFTTIRSPPDTERLRRSRAEIASRSGSRPASRLALWPLRAARASSPELRRRDARRRPAAHLQCRRSPGLNGMACTRRRVSQLYGRSASCRSRVGPICRFRDRALSN
jgi:hypothetical protein